ncbi:MAG: hypothetical protein KY466_09105 [Gemmatimonadetes bacterium]|nr:hypothetical protein [Gemmatimonadota bacterium]
MGHSEAGDGRADSPSGRYAELVRRLRAAVLGGRAATDESLRRGVEAAAAVVSGREGPPGGVSSGAVPPDLSGFVDKVARGAHRVTAEDVQRLREAGYSEDAIFEVTVSAAVGAACGRLERGMAALRGET